MTSLQNESSNCTLLELKGPPPSRRLIHRPCSNCTLLELKEVLDYSNRELQDCSNCTLLELKVEVQATVGTD